jgi:hypothetical protein
MAMRRLSLIALVGLGACTTAGGPYPSLQPRAAEAIEPRLEPARPINDRPVSALLAAQLASLVEQARNGDGAFAAAIAQAEGLAAGAGAPQSESWIVAQQALSGAIAARRPTAMALADIDALTANALRTQGGIAPNDLAAMQEAAAQISAIARAQTNRIDALQQRLGS